MLARFFYAWERRLHAHSKDDRTVRPFDWGLDWLGCSGHRDIPADQLIESWVRTALADSEAFFAAPATTDYIWEVDPAVRQGSPGTVVFPRSITTPDPANNLVYGRLFRAPRRKGGAEDRRRAVLVLPQWNADADGHVGLCQLLSRFGLNALRLSLPYHDRRMPPHLARADYIVSANVVRTVQVCRQAVVDARRAIAWLASE